METTTTKENEDDKRRSAASNVIQAAFGGYGWSSRMDLALMEKIAALLNAEMQAAAYRDILLEILQPSMGDALIDAILKKAGLPGLRPHEARN